MYAYVYDYFLDMNMNPKKMCTCPRFFKELTLGWPPGIAWDIWCWPYHSLPTMQRLSQTFFWLWLLPGLILPNFGEGRMETLLGNWVTVGTPARGMTNTFFIPNVPRPRISSCTRKECNLWSQSIQVQPSKGWIVWNHHKTCNLYIYICIYSMCIYIYI